MRPARRGTLDPATTPARARTALQWPLLVAGDAHASHQWIRLIGPPWSSPAWTPQIPRVLWAPQTPQTPRTPAHSTDFSLCHRPQVRIVPVLVCAGVTPQPSQCSHSSPSLGTPTLLCIHSCSDASILHSLRVAGRELASTVECAPQHVGQRVLHAGHVRALVQPGVEPGPPGLC